MILQTLFVTLAVLLIAMLGLWAVSVAKRDAGIADIFWGAGFVLVAWIAAAWNAPVTWRIWLATSLTTIWGLRLALHLFWRNLSPKTRHTEDRRYAAMRVHHGQRFWWISLFTVFLLQGGILWFVSLPLQIAAAQKVASSFNLLDALGITLWAIGLFFESVGDWQLSRFKADPKNGGKVMDRGLWRYTRHPNYFGDFCIWWGLYWICTAGGAGWTILSPILMAFLLMRVSGVTLLESNIKDRRPDYEAYQARTNAFFPGRRRGE
jgi:steroid 5-alpha reductase family enzyme